MTNQDPELVGTGDGHDQQLFVELAFCYSKKFEEKLEFERRAKRDLELICQFVAKECAQDKRATRQEAERCLKLLDLLWRSHVKDGELTTYGVMRGFLGGLPEPQLLGIGRVLKRWCDDNMPGATVKPCHLPPERRAARPGKLIKQLQELELELDPPALVLTAPEPGF